MGINHSLGPQKMNEVIICGTILPICPSKRAKHIYMWEKSHAEYMHITEST